jgi:biopolymer transport protein ExbD
MGFRNTNRFRWLRRLVVAAEIVLCSAVVAAAQQSSPTASPVASSSSSQNQKPATSAPANVELNAEPIATTGDVSPLGKKLHEVFKDRMANRAYARGMETRSDLPEAVRIEKTVFVRADPSIKLDQFMRVVQAVEDGDAPALLPVQSKAAKVDWMGMRAGRPNPLVLLVRLRQPNSPRPMIEPGVPSLDELLITGGIPVVFASAPKRESVAVITIANDGEYSFGDKRVEKTALANEIRSRINKPGSERVLFVKAAPEITYGSVEDIYHAAFAAGAKRLYVDTGGQTISWAEGNISVTVPNGWRKDEVLGQTPQTFRLKGSEEARLSIDLGTEIEATFSPEDQLKNAYENLLEAQKEGRYEEVRYLDVDGVKGFLTRSVDDDELWLSWTAFRKRNTKLQYVSIHLNSPRASFTIRRDEFYNILSSIKLSQK